MKKNYYFLAGYSRAGNTFLSSILNQNEKIMVTPNHFLVEIIYNLFLLYDSTWLKYFPDTTGLDNMIKKSFDTYYEKHKAEVIFDRAGWGTPVNIEVLKKAGIDKPKFLLLVRPLNEVLASYVKVSKPDNVYHLVNELMHPDKGKIYWDWLSTSNIIKTRQDYLLIKYDDLVKNTEKKIKEIYEFFNIKPFKHTLKNIKQFSYNNVEYKDEYLVPNLHFVKKNIIKDTYKVEDYLPKDIIKRYENWDVF